MYAILRVKVEDYLIAEEPRIDVSVVATGSDKQVLLKQMIDSVGNFYGWDTLEDFYKECRDEIERMKRNGYVEVITNSEDNGEAYYWIVKEI